MKVDEDGFLDVKLTVIAKTPEPWLAGLAEIGPTDVDEERSGWRYVRVVTSAALKERKIRILAYVGQPPTADVTIGFVGADRIVGDESVEIPDVSLAAVPQLRGPASKETLMTALKAVLKEASR